MRSRVLHEEWLSEIECPIIRIEEDISTNERIKIIFKELEINY